MTTEGARIVPPAETVPKDTCDHLLAGPKMNRCPSCQSIMRRCCQSRLGYDHTENCDWAKAMR